MKKILFTGGGSGGHIFPIIAVAEEIKKKDPDVVFSYIGPKDFTAKVFLPKADIKTKFILTGKIRRYFSFKNIVDIFFNIPIGFIQAFTIMFFSAPDLIFSKGGFGSVPVIISGAILRIPIFIHESDVAPGLANRIGANFAKNIFSSFGIDDVEFKNKNKVIETGGPVRNAISNGNKEEAIKDFDIKGGKQVVLILGGSQGSERINEVIFESLPEMLKEFEVIHQTGMKDIRRAEKEPVAMIDKELLAYYHPYFFLDERELGNAYSISDCVVGRSGGGMISEVSLNKKPSVLVPLPESAQNHQVKNAYIYAKNGACLVLEEPNFTEHFFLQKIKNIDKEKMIKGSEEFSRPNAAQDISKNILEYLI